MVEGTPSSAAAVRGEGFVVGFVANLRIYGRLVGARIRADWQYRTSFFLFFTAQAVVAVTDLGAVLVVFSSVDALGGWSVTEVAYLYGASGIAFGLGDVFASPVEMASRHIKQGTFDHFLVRPVGTLWQLLAVEFAPRRLGRIVQPLAVLGVVLAAADISWTPAAVALVPASVVAGAVIYGAIWVITSSIVFWTVESQELANSFTYGGNALTNYPVDILGSWLRRIVTFVVPLASVAYLPATWLFGKPMPFGLPRWTAWSGPVVAAGMLLAARGMWTLALRHYRSTGS